MLKILYVNQFDYSVYDIMNLTASRFLSYLVCHFSKGTLLDNTCVQPKGELKLEYSNTQNWVIIVAVHISWYEGMHRKEQVSPIITDHIFKVILKSRDKISRAEGQNRSYNSRHRILRSDINNIALNDKTRKSITSRNYFKNCWHLSRCESKNFIAKRQLK